MSELKADSPDPACDPWSVPLDAIDVSDAALYANDGHWDYFERLRAEDPVHYRAESPFGPFWSITKFDDIKFVDTHHKLFSSEPTIVIGDQPEDFDTQNFIGMDPPKHDAQRMGVAGAVSQRSLAQLEPIIRERVGRILDELPRGEAFNWADDVSIELTTQMLATLFDFPFEQRHWLPYWSDVATSSPQLTGSNRMTEAERQEELRACLAYFDELWAARAKRPGNDFISMMTQSDAFRHMRPLEYLGNVILLIVGGNDTTRNSITGGVLGLNRHPDEYAKLERDRSLIPNMVSEVIRWQTPLSHMRRRALADTEVGGKQIRAGDKVVMWYVSGNRDEDVFDQAGDLRIERANARQHVAFGYGIHRCMGNRLAEMQLKVTWEEILERFRFVEVVGAPERVHSNFIHGYSSLPVVVHPR